MPTPTKPETPKIVVEDGRVTYKDKAYEINSEGVNSLELIEAMYQEDAISVLRISLLPESYAELREDLKDPETGFTPLSAFMDFMGAFASAVRPTKKA